ncbi:MAG: MATE family efflux transporter [Rhizobacter sp.]|nr:MATE family efflux transporter [Rhizobacter sp.]
MSATTPLPTRAPAAPAPPTLWKTYGVILLPMMLTNVLQAASGTVDGIYLGHLLGLDAIAAVSAFFPVIFALLSVVIGLATGATVLAAQAYGAKDLPTVRAVAGTVLALVLTLGLSISVLGGVFAPQLMRTLGTPPNIIDTAVVYARLMLIGMPLLFLLWYATSLSRGVGDAVTPLWALVIVAAVALVLTPAFIRGWLGLPQLGVASAAVSTLLGFACGTAWTLWHWQRTGHPLAPTPALLRELRFQGPLLKKAVWLGLPTGLQMLSLALAELVLLGLVNRHGSHATAAYGAATQLMNWLQFPAMSLGIAATILASHAIGAGRAHRLGAITRTGLWLNLAVTGGFVLLACTAAPTLIGLFLADTEVVTLATHLLRLVAWTMLLRGASMVMGGVMRASGTVWAPMGLSVATIVCIELPAAWALDARVGLPGIWWAYALTFSVMFVLQLAFFRLVWRRRQVVRLV